MCVKACTPCPAQTQTRAVRDAIDDEGSSYSGHVIVPVRVGTRPEEPRRAEFNMCHDQ